MRLPSSCAAVVATVAALACGANDRESVATSVGRGAASSTADAEPRIAASPVSSRRPRIVALGDSITAGLGLSPDEAYPSLLQRRLETANLDFEVVNAGLSGDTSAGGVSRLEWALQGDVRILIVALGGNDGLRGLPTAELRRNLVTIVETAQARGIGVILAGMEALPNFGQAYTSDFRGVYREVAEMFDVPLIPFLLEGVAGEPALNQSDGIHPTAEGARIVADTVWSVLEPLVVEHAAHAQER